MSAPLQFIVPKGATKQSVVVRIVGLSTGFQPNLSASDQSAGLVLKYQRLGGSGSGADGGISIAPVSIANLSNAHNPGGIKHIADGYYRLDVPDAAFAKAVGVNGVLVTGQLTAMRIEGCLIQLSDTDIAVNSTPKVY